ncbi:MAG TPA: DJ-1/PfpI family protein [Acidimicrobiales bacterium]|nr:DJ-1/PfpI family protein [Acidimicrobiales bacterium]
MRIVFPLYDRFTALDAVGPYEVLSRLPGAEVVFAGAARGIVRTDAGLGVSVDVALGDVGGCDVVVVPGGPGSVEVARPGGGLVEWVRAVHPSTTWTTSVCTGSEILGAAGLLQGLQATTHWAATERLESFGAVYSERRVVVEGKVVTAAGVSSGIDMALTLAALVAGDEVAKAIQLGIEYDPQPPFDSGSATSAAPETVALVRAVLAARDA